MLIYISRIQKSKCAFFLLNFKQLTTKYSVHSYCKNTMGTFIKTGYTTQYYLAQKHVTIHSNHWRITMMFFIHSSPGATFFFCYYKSFLTELNLKTKKIYTLTYLKFNLVTRQVSHPIVSCSCKKKITHCDT